LDVQTCHCRWRAGLSCHDDLVKKRHGSGPCAGVVRTQRYILLVLGRCHDLRICQNLAQCHHTSHCCHVQKHLGGSKHKTAERAFVSTHPGEPVPGTTVRQPLPPAARQLQPPRPVLCGLTCCPHSLRRHRPLPHLPAQPPAALGQGPTACCQRRRHRRRSGCRVPALHPALSDQAAQSPAARHPRRCRGVAACRCQTPLLGCDSATDRR